MLADTSLDRAGLVGMGGREVPFRVGLLPVVLAADKMEEALVVSGTMMRSLTLTLSRENWGA